MTEPNALRATQEFFGSRTAGWEDRLPAVFHAIGRGTLAARHNGVPSDDDVIAPKRLAALCAATGWEVLRIDDAYERYVAVARRVEGVV